MLQVTWFNNIRIFCVQPDLLLICAVLASLTFEFRWALAFCILAGIFKDIFCALPFGLNTALFCLWCVLIIELSKRITIEDDYARLALLFVVVLLHNLVFGLILVYSGSFIPLGIFLRNLSIGTIYTTLFLPLLFEITNPIYT